MPSLTDWIGDANDIAAPKPLQMAKALRQRKVALAQARPGGAQATVNPPRAALAGNGNIFQRRRQGIDDIVNAANQ